MIRQLFKIVFFISFFPILFYSQNKTEIKIKGNKIFSEADYISWIGNIYSIDSAAVNDSIVNRISRGLTSTGYFHFSLDSIISVDNRIEIYITENSPSYIKNYSIAGISGQDSLFIDKICSELTDQIFTAGNIESVIDNILNYYENNGYPFASVKIKNINWLDDDIYGVKISFEIDKKEESKIDFIEIEGNENTDDDVIIRELRLEKGAKYSQILIDQIPERLNRLKFFEPVEKPFYYLNADNKGVLHLTVKEKETNNFDGIIGYVPPANENKNGYFTGYVNVSLRNLFGTGRAFAFRWQTDDRLSQEFELKYLEPWIFNYPFNLNFYLFQRKQDTTYVKRYFNSHLEYLATESITASLILGTGETISTENERTTARVFNSTSLDLGFQLKIDTRDDPYSPTEGLLFINSYKFTQKKILGPPKLLTPGIKLKNNLQNIQLDFSYFQRIFSRQIFAGSIHGRELRGDNIDNGDLYLFGGTNTLRGYREKQFSANRLFWSNLEYRFLLSKRSYAFLFYDYGYYLKKEDEINNTPQVENYLSGYGFGVSLETGLGILAVSYAIAQGNALTQGLIHFGIINEF